LFVYARTNLPKDIPPKNHIKENFCAKIEYLSSLDLVHKCFAKWKWKGYGQGKFEQGQVHIFTIPFQYDRDKRDLGFYGPKLKHLEEKKFYLNLIEEEVHHNDEHDLDLYFGKSSPHASKYSILNNFFHYTSCALTFDVSMIFLKFPSPFIPLMDCNSQKKCIHVSIDFSSPLSGPSFILCDASFPHDYLDEVDASIMDSFINSLCKADYISY